MAAVSPLKVKKLGSKSGSLGSYTGKKLNIPIITVELPYASGKLDADILWDKYGTMLVQGVLFPKERSASSLKTLFAFILNGFVAA